jgi:hypothetical protein
VARAALSDGAVHARQARWPYGLAGVLAAAAASMFAAALATAAMLAMLPGQPVLPDAASNGVSALARTDIPPEYLRLYLQAARRYGLDWAVLAGIGKVECDHGRDPDPSCKREGATNSAGAGGPAQFLASTWSQYGVEADGDGAPPDRWEPIDAIFGMANYLRASGAPGDYHRAIFAYNHAEWYVAEVEHWAALYRGPPGQPTPGVPAPGLLVPGAVATLSPSDGHVALIPADAPAAVQAMIAAGNDLQHVLYGPAGHPDPRGAPEQDCSSTVNYVLYRGGVRSIGEIVRDNPLAQSYVSWGLPGPGRWVTIYATTSPTDHVFIVIAGLRLDTSHDGTDVGPNRFEDGPRWRILDHIPTWATWAVRHPPGL